MVDVVKFCDEFLGFIIMEVKEFNDFFEEKGIKVVVVVVVVVGLVGDGGVEVVVEKDEFDVVLIVVGDKKINVIKEVCVIIGFGLKEVKEMVEGVLKVVKEGVVKVEVEEIKVKFEVVGVFVEFK